ncbi:hypothetical protein K501DRAFT_214231 [Backusella circina FSU 941]|nr:hypothetical protein K501DRAFT_214231 [Backusella circina FSU 941]
MIVFDLDYTLWPEWIDSTYGPPYVYNEKSNTVVNRQNEVLGYFKTTTTIMTLIKSFPDTKIGIASKSSTPIWAKKALGRLRIPELDTTLLELADFIEIYPKSKLNHFKALSEQSGIDCSEMLFFDDEGGNREVTSLGVHFVLVDPRVGITLHQFENALHQYVKKSEFKQAKLDSYFEVQ